jgi:NitT/TauT family transport system ATP-binding protein
MTIGNGEGLAAGRSDSQSAESGPGAPKLRVQGVTIEYAQSGASREYCAVRRVSLDVHRTEMLSVVGPSGCGKSSLLAAIGGLIGYAGGSITEGSILLDGKRVRPGNGQATVFQKAALMPWKNALDNVAYPLRLRGVPRAQARAKAQEALTRVGLANFVDRHPHQLSGGMQQRVNVARALASDPEFLLLDEPFASVDAQMRDILQSDVLALIETTQLSGVFVTHQIDEAVLMGDRVVALSRGPSSTIRRIIDVPLARPRPPEIRNTPEFKAIVDEVWEVVRQEMSSV